MKETHCGHPGPLIEAVQLPAVVKEGPLDRILPPLYRILLPLYRNRSLRPLPATPLLRQPLPASPRRPLPASPGQTPRPMDHGRQPTGAGACPRRPQPDRRCSTRRATLNITLASNGVGIVASDGMRISARMSISDGMSSLLEERHSTTARSRRISAGVLRISAVGVLDRVQMWMCFQNGFHWCANSTGTTISNGTFGTSSTRIQSQALYWGRSYRCNINVGCGNNGNGGKLRLAAPWPRSSGALPCAAPWPWPRNERLNRKRDTSNRIL